jgi:hypothetical protein
MTRNPCRRGHVWTPTSELAGLAGRRCGRCNAARIDCDEAWHVFDGPTCIKCGKTERATT